MIAFDVDRTLPFMKSFYSFTDSSTNYQMEILRALILASHFKCFSIKSWVSKIHRDVLLAIICGFAPGHLPAISSFYNFINRFYIDKPVHKNVCILELNHFPVTTLKNYTQ